MVYTDRCPSCPILLDCRLVVLVGHRLVGARGEGRKAGVVQWGGTEWVLAETVEGTGALNWLTVH